MRNWFWNSLLRRLVKAPVDLIVCLGDAPQHTSLGVRLQTAQLWKNEPISRKLRSVLALKWTPDDDTLQAAARALFLDTLFGKEEDFGPQLLRLSAWHASRIWKFGSLTEHDTARAEALEAFTVLTRLRLAKFRSTPSLNLGLLARNPFVSITAIPMVAKIPVISLCYFLDIHTTFAFESIRRSAHSEADGLISFLYELLLLQQKTAIASHELLRLSASVSGKGTDALLMEDEVDAIMRADLAFSYLKASLEKTIAMTGLVFGIDSLESKRTHDARYRALLAAMPDGLKHTPYGAFLLEHVKSERLQSLNRYRSGILHKRGIADLQPHNYVSKHGNSVPVLKIFEVVHEQHAKNTAILVCALALLTDKLVELDPPDMSQQDLRSIFSTKDMSSWPRFTIGSVEDGS